MSLEFTFRNVLEIMGTMHRSMRARATGCENIRLLLLPLCLAAFACQKDAGKDSTVEGKISSSSTGAIALASVSPSAVAPQVGQGDLPQIQDADADNAPLYSFSHAETRHWIERENSRTPSNADFDMSWHGFDSGAYLNFFEKACKEFKDPTLEPKDEFDRDRARGAMRKAREACMKRLSAEAGAPPSLGRLALPVVDQNDITWDPDNRTFHLRVHADERVLTQRVSPETNQFQLDDASVGYSSCGGPGILVIALPSRGVFDIARTNTPVFDLLVQDPTQAKVVKSRLIAARALHVELVVRVERYGTTGSSCKVGAVQVGFYESKVQAYESRLLAVRLVDGGKRLTNWTSVEKNTASLTQ